MRPVTLAWMIFFAACDGGKGGEATDDTDDTDSADTTGDTDEGGAVCNTENEGCEPGDRACRGEGPRMLPGSDCLACHVRGGDREAPPWSAGGTAFTDENGTAPLDGAIVRITDSTGAVAELETNSSGNFYTFEDLVPPLSAEIELDGAVRTMAATVDNGACNSCHSCEGAAGGKLFAP